MLKFHRKSKLNSLHKVHLPNAPRPQLTNDGVLRSHYRVTCELLGKRKGII